MPSQTARLHNITVDTSNFSKSAFYPVAFTGMSTLNGSDHIDILVFVYDFLDHYDCLLLIGKPICLTTLSADRSPTSRTGLIRGVNYQQSDGAIVVVN